MSSNKGKRERNESSMIRKLIMKFLLVMGACSIMVGCTNESGEKFKAEIKDEESAIIYQIQVKDAIVVKSEEEIIFKLKNEEEDIYKAYLEALKGSLDASNARAGTHTTITSDDKEQLITAKTTVNFEEVNPDEIVYFFGSDYESLLNESELPTWDKVKKGLEEEGYKITPVK